MLSRNHGRFMVETRSKLAATQGIDAMKKILVYATVLTLAGCAYNVTLMPRDSGKTYSGELQGGGGGSGTMTVQLEGITCTGPAARVASSQSFGFISTYGRNSAGLTTTRTSTVDVDGDSMSRQYCHARTDQACVVK